MLKEKTKDIELGDQKYRLTKLDAMSGSYVAAKLALLGAPLMMEQKLTEEALSKMLPALNRRDFKELQVILLKTVQRYASNGMVEPICKADGTIFDEDLAYDIQTIIALTVSAAMFNVGGFFKEAGLMKAPANN